MNRTILVYVNDSTSERIQTMQYQNSHAKVIDIIEEREDYNYSGGTSFIYMTLHVEHDANVTPFRYELERVIGDYVEDSNGYVGIIESVYPAERNVKVYGLDAGRTVTAYRVTIMQEH